MSRWSVQFLSSVLAYHDMTAHSSFGVSIGLNAIDEKERGLHIALPSFMSGRSVVNPSGDS